MSTIIDVSFSIYDSTSESSSSSSSKYSSQPVSIPIEEETQLELYTTSHFNTHIYNDLDQLRYEALDGQIHQHYVRSDSPMTISHPNSHNNSSLSSRESYHLPLKKRFSYQDIERSLEIYYDSETCNKFSSEIDILTTYVKGQKYLYVHAKHYTQWRLHCMMIPALIITAIVTIIAPFIECHYWSGGVISGLNALVALLISLNNYLKLESSVEMYLQMANHFDKLETSLEMANSKLMFLENIDEKKKLVLRKIREVEVKVTDMKESTTILLPEQIKHMFPIICHINIFLFIKKLEVYKKNQILKYRDIKNEIRAILRDESILHKEMKKERLLFLYESKNKVKSDIMDYRLAYGYMDELFSTEIKLAETNASSILHFFCKKRREPVLFHGKNPVIDSYFESIFQVSNVSRL